MMAAPAPAPAPAPRPASAPIFHGLEPEEVENIHVNSKVAMHNAKVAKQSLKAAQNAFKKTKKNIHEVAKTNDKIQTVAGNIKYIYPRQEKEEKVAPIEKSARAEAH